MSFPLYIHGGSDVGRQRTQNEDAFRIASRPEGSPLLVVCDGMGGHEAGEVASQVASDRIVEVLATSSPEHPPRALYQMFVEANQAVLDAMSTRGVPGMGTTGVIAWVLGSSCYVGWVGDSRLYQFRGGLPIERTRDHTRVAQMVSQGLLRPEDAADHPEAHVLVRVLGGSPGAQRAFKPEVWTEPLELQPGDVLLLCSDGLYDLIDDHELYPLIEGRDYQDAVARLIQTANERGGVDNITVILLVAGQPEVPRVTPSAPPPPRRETLPDGMPGLSVPEPLPPPVKSRPVAPSVHASLEPEPPPPPKRGIPLWALVATGAVALGVGLILGLGASQGEPAPAPAPPLPLAFTDPPAEPADSGTPSAPGDSGTP